MNLRSAALASALFILSVGCAVEPDATAPASTTAALAQGLVGTYDFVVDASDVATKLRAKCASESAGDTAAAERCFDAIRTESKLEKIRFSRNASGQLVYTSFAVDGDHEVVFVEVPIAITHVEQRSFVAKADGIPRGTFVGRVTHLLAEHKVERGDDGTIVLVDPRKGRLAYRRAD